jgi:UV DNA damage endonuclease
MGWSVHDLLPICEELNIPFVLDFHHHNIVFDPSQIREGTKDIIELFPRIKATWDRKGITQKMHYSEPTPAAITPRQRRKHSPRVATLPPCPRDMDLMIEAKDKEQAVFELMRTFKLPGYENFNDVLPYTRNDDNKVAVAAINKRSRKSKKADTDADESEIELIPDEDVGMGGPDGRVYWPPGMEEWLRPKKREVKKKDAAEKSAAQIKKEADVGKDPTVDAEPEMDEESDDMATPATKKAKAAMRKKARSATTPAKPAPELPAKSKRKGRSKKLPTPESPVSDELDPSDLKSEYEGEVYIDTKPKVAVNRKASGRRAKKSIDYNEEDTVEME